MCRLWDDDGGGSSPDDMAATTSYGSGALPILLPLPMPSLRSAAGGWSSASLSAPHCPFMPPSSAGSSFRRPLRRRDRLPGLKSPRVRDMVRLAVPAGWSCRMLSVDSRPRLKVRRNPAEPESGGRDGGGGQG